MEQGSSSAKSMSTPSNQKKLSFTDELSAIVNSSQNPSLERESRYREYRASEFEGALNALQSNQAHTSFSRVPLQGEMLSQFDGANADHVSAAYSYGNLLSGDQQMYQASQSTFNNNNTLVSVSDDSDSCDEEPQNTYYNNEMMNRYNLPVSNLPPDQYHLPTTSSSGHRGVQIGSSRTLVPFESSMIDSSVNNAGMHNTYLPPQAQNYAMAPQNLAPLRAMGSYQGIPYDQMSGPPGFEVGANSLNNARTTPTTSALQIVPFESSISAPLNDITIHNTYSMQQNPPTVETSFPSRPMRTQEIPYPMNTLSDFDLGSGSSSSYRGQTTSAALKRKIPSQDDITPNYQNWNTSGRSFHRYSSSGSYSGDGRYTLYDKRYEEVGLPVDPHLRIFLARNGSGNGASSSRRND
ncbi:hypothetical protein C2S52_009237 [Perilla frutescens var. hirtella]|nr:hypothetical protein C2S51_017257 [Perilla frutescens var. frutescens]KAH6784278.1 hypothetical protein C2S52_009237 [Perilla frutescens var. hirtella]